MALNPKQRMFVAEYLKDLNATQATIRAGYKKKNADVTGHQLLGNISISAAIAEGMTAREKRTEIDADYILTNAKELFDRCMERIPVMVRDGRTLVQKTVENGKGEEVGVWEFDSTGANAALKLMASHVRGFIAPVKAELTGAEGKPLVPDNPITAICAMSKAELLKMADLPE